MKSKIYKYRTYVRKVYKAELIRMVQKFIYNNQLFPFYIRQYAFRNLVLITKIKKIKKICKLTARSRYVYSFFYLSRSILREKFREGYNFAMLKR